ncbi:hypothetical protein Sjap_015770 [Stephania japonica]|uniref:RRM domain-containing protein n=1 Tax=Stephania japonica TaxID=461633 RepID=A0AAP0IKU8_9MAGN
MSPGGYVVEVTGLSPNVTEKDLHDFFSFSGAIDHIEIIRSGEHPCTAYVTFKFAHAMDTAVLLSGATILDQRVCITKWGQYEDEFDIWSRPSWRIEEDDGSMNTSHESRSIPTAGEAATMAQQVVKSMVGKGYVLGKDALSKARAFDESHQVSASAAAKVAELSNRLGLTDKIHAGVGAVKSVDEKYNVSETTMSAASATGRAAVTAANAVVNSSYFSKGALWVSDVLTRAAKATADLGSQGNRN